MRRIKILELLKACNLYVPGPYKPEESFKSALVAFYILRCWCTAWVGISCFGIGGQSSTKAIWALIRKHQVLTKPPYSSLILPAIRSGMILEFFAFSWNAVCVIVLYWVVPWHILLCVVDLGALIGLSVSQSQQYTFTPRSNSTCSNITYWQQPANGQPNFFALAANLTNDTPLNVCGDMYGAMVWQAVVIFHEGLIVFFAITFSMPVGHLFHIYTLPGAIIRFATLIPREWFYSLWFLNRYRERRWKSSRASKDIELAGMKIDFIPAPGPRTKMEEVLQLEEAVLVIAAELHYTNLVRLGQTSKRIRELIFPHGDLSIRKAKLRRVACRTSTLTTDFCWNCNIKVCDGCCVRDITNDTAARNTLYCFGEAHFATCQPYCTKCYYTRICRNLSIQKRKPCSCNKTVFAGVTARLCISCYALDDHAGIRMAGKARLAKRKAENVKNCTGCEDVIGGGRVWWICSCGKECRNEVHIVKTRANKDLEAG